MSKRIQQKERKKEYQKQWYLKNKDKINSKHKTLYKASSAFKKVKKLELKNFEIKKEIEYLEGLVRKNIQESYNIAKKQVEAKNPDFDKYFSKYRATSDSLGFDVTKY